MVTFIIPCRNEWSFICPCLDSLLANEYPEDRLEIIVIDGMSTDGTRRIVTEYSRRYSAIRLIDNPHGITPVAMNIGIRNARGEYIGIIGAHALVAPDYVRRCVETLQHYEADNVGGIMVTLPQKDGFVGKTIVACLSTRFGVGNSYFRTYAKKPIWVDTVFGGCYRRSVFDRVGYFNESLIRGQDMEFNLRLKRAGGKILLVPDIVSYYYARSTISAFLKHNWTNGVWAIMPFRHSRIIPVSIRHLIPLAFAANLMACAVLSLFWQVGVYFLLGILLVYFLVGVFVSLRISTRERNPLFSLAMPFAFFGLHFSYGLGSLWGIARLLTRRDGT